MWEFVINEKTERELIATRDRLMSLMIGKKLIVKRSYLRKEELAYLQHLQSALGDKYVVKPQVHLSDIADVKFGYYDHDNLYYDLKRIILDYVVFDSDYNPLVGVELNGSSHLFNHRKSRDCLAENLLHNIGVEYYEIDLSKKFDPNKIRLAIENKIATVRQHMVTPHGISDKIT